MPKIRRTVAPGVRYPGETPEARNAREQAEDHRYQMESAQKRRDAGQELLPKTAARLAEWEYQEAKARLARDCPDRPRPVNEKQADRNLVDEFEREHGTPA